MNDSASQISILSIKSWLFTPGTKPDLFPRAGEAGAGALVIDLEDSVVQADKTAARATHSTISAAKSSDHIPCALRINSPDREFGDRDLQSVLASSVTADFLILPKSESPHTIGRVIEALALAEKQTRVIALIETIAGVRALDQLQKPIAGRMHFLSAPPTWLLIWARPRNGNRFFLPDQRDHGGSQHRDPRH